MSFDEVLGHDVVRAYLARAFRHGRISHAYLLSGPEGIGKALLARQLAAALLCRQSGVDDQDAEQIDGCGDCGGCQAIESGNHGGLQILDSAEGRGIDLASLREMMRSLSLRSGDRRIVIIDPAERLQEAAANALLKILEEPAQGVVFLLCSHRPAQLLRTIVSRCQQISIGPLTREAFLEVLSRYPIDAADAEQLFAGIGGRPGAAIGLFEALQRCGGEVPFREILQHPPRDARNLVALADVEGGQSDREAVYQTIRILADGVWAFRSDDVDGRRLAAERATMLAHVARHVERSGSPDLCLEATLMILSALDLDQLRLRMPRSLGVA